MDLEILSCSVLGFYGALSPPSSSSVAVVSSILGGLGRGDLSGFAFEDELRQMLSSLPLLSVVSILTACGGSPLILFWCWLRLWVRVVIVVGFLLAARVGC